METIVLKSLTSPADQLSVKTTEYPYERLRLACGCHEVETAPGATNVYGCPMHAGDAAEYFLAKARVAISEHGICTVQNGGGIKNLGR